MRCISLVLTFLAASVAAGEAQVVCTPTKDSHEAQLFAALAVPLAYSTAEAPATLPPGRVRVGLEGTYLPDIDETTRTATQCRPGKGPEHTDLLFATHDIVPTIERLLHEGGEQLLLIVDD